MKLWPILAPVLGFVFGIALASLISVSLPILIWFLILALASFLFWQRHQKNTHVIWWYFVAIFMTGLAVGAWWMNKNISAFEQSPLNELIGEAVTLEGVVYRDIERGPSSAKVYIKTTEGNILLFIDRHAYISYGDRILFTGELLLPESFLTDLGRTFDYKNYLRAQGAGLLMRYPEIEILSRDEGNPIIDFLLMTKYKFIDQIEGNLTEPSSGLGLGLLLGVKGAISEELEESFRRAGVIHIVVLSGYNIMLVVGFVLFILGRLVRARTRFILGVAAIVCFACVVGFSATVVRASLMAALLLFVELTGRRYDALRALMVAGFFMLVLNPYLLLYDVGFQLSFVATWGLIVFSPAFEKWLTFIPTTLGARSLVGATLATQLAVLPLLLYQIGEVSLVSILANLLILPMVPVAMLFTFMLGVVSAVLSTFTLPLIALAHVSLAYIILVAGELAGWSFAVIAVPSFSPYLVLLMYIFLLYQWLRPKRSVVESTELLKGWTMVEEKDLLITPK